METQKQTFLDNGEIIRQAQDAQTNQIGHTTEMIEITADEFTRLVSEQPDWAAHLTQPVRVKGRLALNHSPITHLSKHLIFDAGIRHAKPTATGYSYGSPSKPILLVAEFSYCKALKEVTGTFKGPVHFRACGFDKIAAENFHIELEPEDHSSAYYTDCNELQVLEGNYPKYVLVRNCNKIRKVENLVLGKKELGPNPPTRLSFECCEGLQWLPDWLINDPTTISIPRKFRIKMLESAKVRPVIKQPSITIE